MATKNIIVILAIMGCCLLSGIVEAQYGMPPPPPSSYSAPIAPGWPAPPSPDNWASINSADSPAPPPPSQPLSPWDG